MLNKILQQPKLKDIDIVLKCKKYPEFRKQLQQIDKNYSNDLNRSIYTNLTKIQQPHYFDIIKRHQLYINFYGFRIAHLNQQELHKLYLLWVMKMDQEIRKYTVIYYHSMATSLTPFVFIRDMFKKLPIQYYALLDKIYVVQSSFLIRNAGAFEFGRLYKLYSRRIQFIQKYKIHNRSLKQLNKIDEIRKNQIIQTLPDILTIQQQYDKTKQTNNPKQQYSNSFTFPNNNKKQTKKDCLTIRLSQHQFNQNHMPIHFITLIDTLRNNVQMLKLQGIFRKAGSIQEQQDIILELADKQKSGSLSQPQTGPYSGYAVAGVIKKIFTKLDHPIVPYTTYNKIMALQGIKQQEQITLVKDIIFSLPQKNKNIILYLIQFIKNQVLIYQENKMNFRSMSVVLSPCFFRPQVTSLQDLLNSGRFASIVNILFQNFQQIATNEENKNSMKNGEKRGSRNSNGQGSLQPRNTNTF